MFADSWPWHIIRKSKQVKQFKKQLGKYYEETKVWVRKQTYDLTLERQGKDGLRKWPVKLKLTGREGASHVSICERLMEAEERAEAGKGGGVWGLSRVKGKEGG